MTPEVATFLEGSMVAKTALVNLGSLSRRFLLDDVFSVVVVGQLILGVESANDIVSVTFHNVSESCVR